MTIASSALESFVSPHVGVVRAVDELLGAPDDARLFHAVAFAGDQRQLLGAGAETFEGGTGYGPSRATARAAALGEAIERYAASYVPDHELVLASADELDGAVDPGRFALFAPEQHADERFPFVPFARSTRIRWVRGRSLATGDDAWLPAQLVYLPWRRLADGEQEIAYSTSNGLACGRTADEALLAALLELVERDAFMITWAARLSFPRLTWRRDADLVAFERRHLAPAGLRHSAVDLSAVHGVPTVLAVVHADARCPGELGVGAAAAPTAREACRKAFVEAYAVHRGARALALGPRRPFRADFADVVEFTDHIHVYALREHAAHAAFLDASRRRRSISDVPPLEGEHAAEHVAALLERLAARSLEAFCVDVTAPDVREAGLHVFRAVVPELCPLDVRHDARFLGAERLRRVPYELGLRPRPLRIDELNPYPHPFP